MDAGIFAVTHIAVLSAGLAAAALALMKGGPKQPTPVESINEPFKTVDLSDLPALERVTARDNTQLAYRTYLAHSPLRQGSAVLIHGSSASSKSLHSMARQFAEAGYTTYVPDIRGHGESGRRGTISYIGQLEDDIEDFLNMVKPEAPRILVGFSAGGGFALRFAADRRRRAFDCYLLLSPFLHHKARTSRPAAGGWANVGRPRTIVLVLLNKIGIRAFNHLHTIAYALTPEAQAMLTPQYSFNLMQNFRPSEDYRADIRAAAQPLKVLVGADDEAFHASEFAAAFAEAGRAIPVTIVPNTNHIGLTLQRQAIGAVLSAIDSALYSIGDAKPVAGADPATKPA